jgi:hypothetical protein
MRGRQPSRSEGNPGFARTSFVTFAHLGQGGGPTAAQRQPVGGLAQRGSVTRGTARWAGSHVKSITRETVGPPPDGARRQAEDERRRWKRERAPRRNPDARSQCDRSMPDGRSVVGRRGPETPECSRARVPESVDVDERTLRAGHSGGWHPGPLSASGRRPLSTSKSRRPGRRLRRPPGCQAQALDIRPGRHRGAVTRGRLVL